MNRSSTQILTDGKRFGTSISIAVAVVAMLTLLHWLNLQFNFNLRDFSVFPRRFSQLPGAFTMHFFHSDWKHLTNNGTALLVLVSGVYYFYRETANKLMLWSIVMSGLWLWVAGRPGYHIGASAIVYALASYIFFGGILRKYYRTIALSMIVVFIYGSMIWGVFPIKPGISWEGHLFGAIAGAILAWFWRHEGIRAPKPKSQELEETELWNLEQHFGEAYWEGKRKMPKPEQTTHTHSAGNFNITYTLTKNSDGEKPNTGS